MDDILEEMNDVRTELSKIYLEIVKSDEISRYKSYLIQCKMLLLADKIEELCIEIDDYCAQSIKELYLSILTSMIIIWASFATCFVDPILGLLGGTIGVLFKHGAEENYLDKLNQSHLALFDELDQEMEIIGENCFTFLPVKMKNRVIRLEANAQSEDESMYPAIANMVVDEYLDLDKIIEVPPYIEKIIVEMLQHDLETDEVDYHKLLELAKARLSDECLLEELQLIRKP